MEITIKLQNRTELEAVVSALEMLAELNPDEVHGKNDKSREADDFRRAVAAARVVLSRVA